MRASRLWQGSNHGLAMMIIAAGLFLCGPGPRAKGADDAKDKEAGAGERAPAKARLELIDQRLREAWEQASIKPSTMPADSRPAFAWGSRSSAPAA